MPIFEFSCLDCTKESEILVRSAEWEGEAECPSCGSHQLEKMLSVFTATGSNDAGSISDSATCSGMPSNCGRCGLDN
jgi:putative FmdB family regulatory protein